MYDIIYMRNPKKKIKSNESAYKTETLKTNLQFPKEKDSEG